jgi:hypothetical protein
LICHDLQNVHILSLFKFSFELLWSNQLKGISLHLVLIFLKQLKTSAGQVWEFLCFHGQCCLE